MNGEMLILALTLLGMGILSIKRHHSIEFVTLLGLGVLLGTGVLRPEEAFSGFASPTVIALASAYSLAIALRINGASEFLSQAILESGRRNETMTIFFVVISSATLSAFIGNASAVALMLPAVSVVCAKASIPPPRLFIPLSFGAVVGGTLTAIGAPSNLVVSEILISQGLPPFNFFDFLPLGVWLLAISLLFFFVLGKKLLPKPKQATSERENLPELYKLNERFFTVKIPTNSHLDGYSLKETHLGEKLGLQVVAIYRGEHKILAPQANDKIYSEDVLLVRGRLSDFTEIFRLNGLEEREISSFEFSRYSGEIRGITFKLKSSGVGKTLRSLNFRENFGLTVVAIDRNATRLYSNIQDEILKTDDICHAFGELSLVERFSETSEVEVIRALYPAIEVFHDNTSLFAVPPESSLIGITIRNSKLSELVGLTVVGIVRSGVITLAVDREEVIQADDGLIVSGSLEALQLLSQIAEFEIVSQECSEELESPEIGLIEVVLSPRCKLLKHTLEELDFRLKYGFTVLAVWRDGAAVKSKLGSLELKYGDALLLQGPRVKMHLLANNPNFIALSDSILGSRESDKLPVVLFGLVVMISLIASGMYPVHVATFIGALVTVLFGAVTLEDLYREIDWRLLFVVGSLLPVSGLLVQNNFYDSASLLLSESGFFVTPLMTIFLTSIAIIILSHFLDGLLVTILFSPLVLMLAQNQGYSEHGLLMTLALSSSMVFVRPSVNQAHLLVSGAGGYSSQDFRRVGFLFTLFMLIGITISVGFAFGLLSR